jgi:WD40 repeat protein
MCHSRIISVAYFAKLTLLLCCAAELPAETPRAPESVFREHQRAVMALAFSPDGLRLASGGDDKRVVVHELQPQPEDPATRERRSRLLLELDDSHYETRQAAYAELSAMGPESVSDLEHCLETTRSAEVRMRVRQLLMRHRLPSGVGHEGTIRDLAFSPDGKFVASAGHDDSVFLWQTLTVKPVQVLRAHSDGIWSVCYSQDGQSLMTGGGDSRINVWDTNTYQRRNSLMRHQSNVQSLALSHDGKLFASAGGFDESVVVWATASGAVLRDLKPEVGAVLSVAFHPTDSSLVIAGYSDRLVIIDVSTWEVTSTMRLPFAVIRSLSFSSDGHWLAAAGRSNAVTIVDWPQRLIAEQLGGHTEPVHAACFRASDNLLATGDDAGVVRLWALPQHFVQHDSQNGQTVVK